MVNFAEKAQKMEDITFTSLLPLLSTELDKSRAQLQYKTHSQAVFWKDEIPEHHQKRQAQY